MCIRDRYGVSFSHEKDVFIDGIMLLLYICPFEIAGNSLSVNVTQDNADNSMILAFM